MAHSNRDIAQEAAEEFLSKEIWELVEECYDKNGWNEMYVVKISKRDKVRRIVRTHLSAYPDKPGMEKYLKNTIGIMGSFCLKVSRKPKEIKHVWNLPFTKQSNLIVPDGRASSLILDSVSKLNDGRKCIRPESYASLGSDA
jgi:hypothetical protein